MPVSFGGRLRPHSAFICAALVAAFAISSASAHVTLERAEAKPNSGYKAILRVPHGCDGSPTTSISVTIPEGVIEIKPQPKPGWTLATEKGAYARAYEVYGHQVSDGVKKVTWSGGALPADQYDEFTFVAYVTGDAAHDGKVAFPTLQGCAKGEVNWSEVSNTGDHNHGAKAPAPILRIADGSAPQPPMGTTGQATANPIEVGDLTISSAWTRATPVSAKVGGGYLTITNRGKVADRLVSGTSDIAGRVEIHEMSMDGGVMKMRELPKGLEIAPGATVELKPGGYHVMLQDLKQQLKEGSTFKAHLVFEKAGPVDVTFTVGSIAATSAPGTAGGMSHDSMSHDKMQHDMKMPAHKH